MDTNFTVGLDLQGTMRLIYANLLYRSTYFDLLDRNYLEAERTGMPIIEVILDKDTPLNRRSSFEIPDEGLKNTLANYGHAKVDLTQLPLDYSFRISPIVLNSGVERAVDSQIERKNAQIAKEIDTFGYNKMNKTITGSEDGSLAYVAGQVSKWAPTTAEEVVDDITHLRAQLFNRDVYDRCYLALEAIAYAFTTSKITQVLKYETKAGIEGVDRGEIASAYGVDFIEVNSNVISKDEAGNDNNVIGYFGNEVGQVGDLFFSSMAQYNGNYPKFPGYYVVEGNLSFGSEVVRPEAIIKLVESIPTVDAGSFDEGTNGQEYAHTTAFSGTDVAEFKSAGLPAGLVLNPASGEITGTPTEAGTYDVTIYGVDKFGNYSNPYKGTITIA